MNCARSLAPVLAAFLGPAWMVFAGCTTPAPTIGYTPITGIQIHASDIVAGHGCGTGPQQVYRYAAVVAYATPDGAAEIPFTSGVFDCFADGIFSNLPLCSGQSFDVTIYAYNYASCPPAFDGLPDGQRCPDNGSVQASDGSLDASDEAATVDAGTGQLWQASANWKTTCTVTQQPGVTTGASCGALEPLDAGSTGSDATASE